MKEKEEQNRFCVAALGMGADINSEMPQCVVLIDNRRTNVAIYQNGQLLRHDFVSVGSRNFEERVLLITDKDVNGLILGLDKRALLKMVQHCISTCIARNSAPITIWTAGIKLIHSSIETQRWIVHSFENLDEVIAAGQKIMLSACQGKSSFFNKLKQKVRNIALHRNTQLKIRPYLIDKPTILKMLTAMLGMGMDLSSHKCQCAVVVDADRTDVLLYKEGVAIHHDYASVGRRELALIQHDTMKCPLLLTDEDCKKRRIQNSAERLFGAIVSHCLSYGSFPDQVPDDLYVAGINASALLPSSNRVFSFVNLDNVLAKGNEILDNDLFLDATIRGLNQ